MDEGALIWWEELREDLPTSMEDAISLIRKAFTPVNYQQSLKDLLRSKIQLPNQSIRDFVREVQGICRELDPHMTDILILDYIYEGVIPSLKKYMYIKKFKTVNEFLKFGNEQEEKEAVEKAAIEKRKIYLEQPTFAVSENFELKK